MKTLDGVEFEKVYSGSRPPEFDGQQCGLYNWIRIGTDWYIYDNHPVYFHVFWQYVESGLFTAEELINFVDQQLTRYPHEH